MNTQHYTIDELKTQAKALRRSLAGEGHVISHSKSLETLAKQFGCKDWNTLHSLVNNNAPNITQVPYALGEPVRGVYLGQAFEGQIVALRKLSAQNRYGLSIKFDVPVDVVKFEGMNNFRSRVNVTLDDNGRSIDKTSDGQPHMVLQM